VCREDDVTGLYYYRARYYAPDLHRFLGQDFILRAGANRYAYVGNNPVGAIDPFGLDTIIIGGGSPSSGPGGSSAGPNPLNRGLTNIVGRLVEAGEPVAIFSSGQQREIMERARQIREAGRPLFIIGFSLGGRRAVEVVNALGPGLTPDHLFTIDPFIANDTSVPPGVPTTNFYQQQSFINGRPIQNATNIEIAGPGVGHFSLPGHPTVQQAIIEGVLGPSAGSGGALGGRY
jgi:RHS repeat-associated protein